MISSAGLARNLVIVTCAISAGIHGALTPLHVEDGTGAGLGFLAATILLAAVAATLSRHASTVALLGGVGVLAGLLATYALAVTTGVPVLHPDVEPVDGLAVFTKAVESVGLLGAAHLLWRDRVAVALDIPRSKGTTT